MKRFLFLWMFFLCFIGGAFADEVLIDFPKAQTGITIKTTDDNQVKYNTVKIHNNTDAVEGLQFGKTFKYTESEYYYAILGTEGGFKKGDVISIAGVFNNSDDSKKAAIAFYSDPEKAAIWTTENFINGRTSASDPVAQTFTLTEDAANLYIGRSGNTSTYITSLQITRAAQPVEFSPVDLNFNQSTWLPTSASGVSDGDFPNGAIIRDCSTGVVLEVSASGAKTPNRFWKTNNGPQLRVYGGTLTFTAPEGKKLSKITFSSAKWNTDNKADVGDLNDGVWTGSAEKVVITIAGNTQINSIVNVVGVPAPEKLYVIGDMNGWDLANMTEMTWNEETQAFEFKTVSSGNFALSDIASIADNNWDDFNANHRWACGNDVTYIYQGGEYQIEKNTSGNSTLYLEPLGILGVKQYVIRITKDMKLTVTLEDAPVKPVEQLYIIGNIAPNDWSLSNMMKMAYNEETKAFEYQFEINREVWFAFSDVPSIENEDWNLFNNQHRYALAGNNLPSFDQEIQLAKFDGTVYLNQPGTYKISVTKDLKMTVTFKPLTVDKLYIVGDNIANGWDIANMTEMAWNEETQAFEYTGQFGDWSYFAFSDVASATDWDVFNNNNRFSTLYYSEIEGESTYQLTKSGSSICFRTNGTYKISVTKDLKMTISKVYSDVTVDNPSNDLTQAIYDASWGKFVKNLTINLDASDYVVSQPIEANGSVTINGKDGAKIDASALEEPLILMSSEPIGEAINDYYRINNIKIKDVQITGIKNSIFYDNNTKYCVVDFTIENSVLGLATENVQNEALISFQAGGAKDFTIKNSTVYGNNAVAKYFLRYNGSARIDRFGYNESGKYEPEHTTMTYQNNTFYNLLKNDGQWFNGSGVTNGTTYTIEKNIWVDCNGNKTGNLDYIISGRRYGSGASATWDKNTYFYQGIVNTPSKDNSGTALPTNPKFVSPETGNFTVNAGSAQAKEKTGDPRWLVEYDENQMPAKDIVVEVANGADILATVKAKEEEAAGAETGEYFKEGVGDITINLANGGNYTLDAPIENATGDIIINGKGATIDASNNEGALIKLSEAAAVAPRRAPANPDASYRYINNITIKNITITGIKGNIFYDDNVKTCVDNFTIENAVLGLATEAVENEALISFKAQNSGIKDFTIKNSTVYGTGAVAKYFVCYENGARIDRFGYNESGKYAPEHTTMTYLNNTFYNVLKSDGEWGNYRGISNGTVYDIQNNIWVACGNGQIARRIMGNGRLGSGASATWNNNSYFDAEYNAISQGSYDTGNVLTTKPKFFDAENADFAIDKKSDQARNSAGDLRWGIWDPAIWSSDEAVAVTWSTPINIPAVDVSVIHIGDRITVDLTSANAGGQVGLASNGKPIEGLAQLAGGEPQVTFTATGDIVRIIKEGGLQIWGNGFSANRLNASAEFAGRSNKTIWVGDFSDTKDYNWDTSTFNIDYSHFVNANNFDGVKAGDVIRINATLQEPGSYCWANFLANWGSYSCGVVEASNDGMNVTYTVEITDEIAQNLKAQYTQSVVFTMNCHVTSVELLSLQNVDLNDIPVGADIAVTVNDAVNKIRENDDVVGDITLNLPAGEFTASETIVVPNSFVIKGAGAGGDKGTADATVIKVTNPWNSFIALTGTTKQAKSMDGMTPYWLKNIENIEFNGVKITGLQSSLVSDWQSTVVNNLKFGNSVLDEGGYNTIFNVTLPINTTIDQSTIYSIDGHYGQLISAWAGIIRQGYNVADKQTVTISKSTLYQIAQYTNLNYFGDCGMESMVLNLDNTILYNTGAGSGVYGWFGGSTVNDEGNYVATANYNNNTYFAYGADATEWTESYIPGSDQSGTVVYGAPLFRKDITAGIFTLGVCPQIGKQVGDPRWYNIPMITKLQEALDKAAALLDVAQADWQTAPAANEAIEMLAGAYNENVPYLDSNSQEEVDDATLRVEAAIAEFEKVYGSNPTAIKSVDAVKADGTWYTINGQRISKPTEKGIYIHNGRKVVVK